MGKTEFDYQGMIANLKTKLYETQQALSEREAEAEMNQGHMDDALDACSTMNGLVNLLEEDLEKAHSREKEHEAQATIYVDKIAELDEAVADYKKYERLQRTHYRKLQARLDNALKDIGDETD